MRRSSIKKLLGSLGLHSSSPHYNHVRIDISSFLKDSIDINMASDDDLRGVAGNYLAKAVQGTRVGYWSLDPPLEEHRRQLMDIIYGVMVCNQVYALDGLHRTSPCPGCREHPQRSYGKENGTASLTTSSNQQSHSLREPPPPQVSSDVENIHVKSQSGIRFNPWPKDSSSLSPGVDDDDPNDLDYRGPRSHRKRRRLSASSNVRYTPSVMDSEERDIPQLEGTVFVKASSPAPCVIMMNQLPLITDLPCLELGSSSSTKQACPSASPLSGAESPTSNTQTSGINALPSSEIAGPELEIGLPRSSDRLICGIYASSHDVPRSSGVDPPHSRTSVASTTSTSSLAVPPTSGTVTPSLAALAASTASPPSRPAPAAFAMSPPPRPAPTASPMSPIQGPTPAISTIRPPTIPAPATSAISPPPPAPCISTERPPSPTALFASGRKPPPLTTPSTSVESPRSSAVPFAYIMNRPSLAAPPTPGANPVDLAASQALQTRVPVRTRDKTWTFTTTGKQAEALLAARACQFDVLESAVREAFEGEAGRIMMAALRDEADRVDSLLEGAVPERQADKRAVAFRDHARTVDAMCKLVHCDDRLLHRKRMTQLDRKIEDCFMEHEGW